VTPPGAGALLCLPGRLTVAVVRTLVRGQTGGCHCVGPDLSAKLRKEVSAQLVSTAVTTAVTTPEAEREIVQEAAAQVVALVREHRGDIRRLRETGGTLWQQLEEAIGSRETLEELIAES